MTTFPVLHCPHAAEAAREEMYAADEPIRRFDIVLTALCGGEDHVHASLDDLHEAALCWDELLSRPEVDGAYVHDVFDGVDVPVAVIERALVEAQAARRPAARRAA